MLGRSIGRDLVTGVFQISFYRFAEGLIVVDNMHDPRTVSQLHRFRPPAFGQENIAHANHSGRLNSDYSDIRVNLREGGGPKSGTQQASQRGDASTPGLERPFDTDRHPLFLGSSISCASFGWRIGHNAVDAPQPEAVSSARRALHWIN